MKPGLNVYLLIFTVFFGCLYSCKEKHENPDPGLAALTGGRSAAVSSHAPAFSNFDRLQYIKPGETTELANITGPSIINHIWLTFNETRPRWLESGGSANPAGIDIIYEGKDLIKSFRHSPGMAELQSGYDWTGDGQILFMPSGSRAWMETDFQVEKEEPRGLVIRMTHSHDYGIYRIFIDGTAIPNVPMTIDMDFNAPSENVNIFDLYSENLLVKDYYLGSTTLKEGKHTIRFEATGKNDNSTGNYLGFDSFRLRERWNKKRASLR